MRSPRSTASPTSPPPDRAGEGNARSTLLVAPPTAFSITGGYRFNAAVRAHAGAWLAYQWVPAERLVRCCRHTAAETIILDSLFLTTPEGVRAIETVTSTIGPSCLPVLLAHGVPEVGAIGADQLPLFRSAIAPSVAVRKLLSHRGIPEAAIAVVNPGIDAQLLIARTRRRDRLEQLRSQQRTETPPTAAPVQLLTVANLSPVKGILELADTIAEGWAEAGVSHRELVWHLVGRADPGGAILRKLDDHPVRVHLRRHGAVPCERVAELLQVCDAFVLASRSETFGMAIAEAAAVGVPIIASNVGGIPEAAGPGACLLDPVDRDGWRRALADLFRAAPDGPAPAGPAPDGDAIQPVSGAEPRTWAVVAADLRRAVQSIRDGRLR